MQCERSYYYAMFKIDINFLLDKAMNIFIDKLCHNNNITLVVNATVQ